MQNSNVNSLYRRHLQKYLISHSLNGIIHNNDDGGDDDQKVKFIVKLLIEDCILRFCWYSNKSNNITFKWDSFVNTRERKTDCAFLQGFMFLFLWIVHKRNNGVSCVSTRITWYRKRMRSFLVSWQNSKRLDQFNVKTIACVT